MIERTDEEAKLLNIAYQQVFKGKSTAQQGQMVFWDIMDRCHIFQPFNQQNAGAYAMEGRRELALHIMEMVELTPNVGGVDAVRVMEEIKESMADVGKLYGTAQKQLEE